MIRDFFGGMADHSIFAYRGGVAVYQARLSALSEHEGALKLQLHSVQQVGDWSLSMSAPEACSMCTFLCASCKSVSPAQRQRWSQRAHSQQRDCTASTADNDADWLKLFAGLYHISDVLLRTRLASFKCKYSSSANHAVQHHTLLEDD
eukprot:TRINITY_DN2248_c1_g1_i1.p1 TRINITY_DN2248_c1_g1~~TRINITY_DN2248_c1_g1_i1.p1  ORF type:complete len:148 (-),score=11.31 TRINITY_DN2248_c1_g1_i1:530-973(-)